MVPEYVVLDTPSAVLLVPLLIKSDFKCRGRGRTSELMSRGDHTCSGFGVVPLYAPCQIMCLEAPIPASTDFVGSAFGMELEVGCSRTGLQPQKKAKVIVNPVTTCGFIQETHKVFKPPGPGAWDLTLGLAVVHTYIQ